MKSWPLLCALFCLLSCGCAEHRILNTSNSFSDGIDSLGEKEVIDNIDKTIDNPYRIPTRTTFGKGSLTFTDNSQASVAIPLHLFATNPGSAAGQIGAITDTYQLSINPETNSVVLAALRDLYRSLVYPGKFQSLTPVPGAKERWLFWKNLDGSESGHEPPDTAFFVGRGRTHDLYVTDLENYYDFIFLTFGYVTSTRPGYTFSEPAPVQAPAGSERKEKTAKEKGRKTVERPRLGVPDQRAAPQRLFPAPPAILERPSPTDNPSAIPVPRT